MLTIRICVGAAWTMRLVRGKQENLLIEGNSGRLYPELLMLKQWGWLSAFVIVLDQATKYLAEALLVMHQPVPVLPSFNLMLTYNTGAAFSFLAGAGGWQRWFFLGLGSLVSIGLIVWLRRLKPGEKWLAAALALILAERSAT